MTCSHHDIYSPCCCIRLYCVNVTNLYHTNTFDYIQHLVILISNLYSAVLDNNMLMLPISINILPMPWLIIICSHLDTFYSITVMAHECHGIWNQQHNSLFRLTRKETFIDDLHYWLFVRESTNTGGFPSQRASNAASMPMPLHHQVCCIT